MKKYVTQKTRLPRKENTRWLKYAIEKKIITPIPATGQVLRRDGTPHKEMTNPFGYKYIKVYMLGVNFSFYVHKCVYVALHGNIPKNKELDHHDGDIDNNVGSNIIAKTMKQNLKKRKYKTISQRAF